MKNSIISKTNFFFSIHKKSAHLFYKKFITPKSDNEDVRRREFILNIILNGSILLISFASLCNLKYFLIDDIESYSSNAVPIYSLLVILIFFIVLLLISRFGYPRVSSFILIGVYFILTTFMAYKWGIELTTVLIFYALVIIMAGILLRSSFAFSTAIASSLTILIIGYLQIENIIIPDLSWKEVNIKIPEILVITIIFLILATISWLSNREIEKSLKRARRSEAELKKERDSLEIKVEERTKELKETQMKEVAQLYRFAEFGRLSSGLFHDLVNPLTVVSLNLEHLKESDVPEIQDAKSGLSQAVAATKKMEDFIIALRRQLKRESQRKIFSLTEEIIQIIQILYHKAEKAGVELIFLPTHEIKTFGDSVKFSQIAINLLSNAIDAYDKSENKNRNIEIELIEKKNKIIFMVNDYGKGIPAKFIDKIFEPFFTTKAHKGTGIGLSSTKEIVEKDFKGKIEVISQENKKTTFTITLPRKL